MPAVVFDYTSIVTSKYPAFLRDSADWMEWRYCYEGGRIFRDVYLKKYSERETNDEFVRRREMTPIPTYAKKEINRVRNSLFQRFPDILRRQGSPDYLSAMVGDGGGVDRKGTSMNSFLGRDVLPDLLVMGKVGVLVDAPRYSKPVDAMTRADENEIQPYLYTYPLEQIPMVIPSDTGQQGQWKALLLVDRFYDADFYKGVYSDKTRMRWYYLGDDGRVRIQMLTPEGKEAEAEIVTNLTKIPFVLFDIGDSLMKDVCSYQRALLNLISSDTAYSHDANFAFLTRQRKNANPGEHLQGENKKVEAGLRKGLFYEKDTERPQFIAPPAEPMKISLEFRRELKNEIRELVSGQLEGLGEEGTVESGLAYIGLQMETAENEIADHWLAYKGQTRPTKSINRSADDATEQKDQAIVKYPECYTIKPVKERIEETQLLTELMYKIPGRIVKKEIAKKATDSLLRGSVPTKKLKEMHEEIEEAPYCTSDPAIVIEAKKNGAMSGETACLALGGTAEEWKKAEEDQAKRAAAIVAAQADAGMGAARGNPDGSKDPESAKLAKEGDNDPTAKLGGGDDQGTRGKDNPFAE